MTTPDEPLPPDEQAAKEAPEAEAPPVVAAVVGVEESGAGAEAEPEAVAEVPDAVQARTDIDSIANILEAVLLAADAPLSLDALQRLLTPEMNLSRAELRDAMEHLAVRLRAGATEPREVAGGWRLQVRAEYSHWVARLWQEKPPKFTRAALETLALIVYRQPITRGEIEDIRGVAVSSNILRTLLERGWIRELGHKEVPGRPALFGTTTQFLDDFGLKTLDQLPALPEIKDAAQLEAALARLAPGMAAASDGGDTVDESRTSDEPGEGGPAALTDSNPQPDGQKQSDATIH